MQLRPEQSENKSRGVAPSLSFPSPFCLSPAQRCPRVPKLSSSFSEASSANRRNRRSSVQRFFALLPLFAIVDKTAAGEANNRFPRLFLSPHSFLRPSLPSHPLYVILVLMSMHGGKREKTMERHDKAAGGWRRHLSQIRITIHEQWQMIVRQDPAKILVWFHAK